MSIIDVINELKKFSDDLLDLGKPVDEKDISDFETRYNLSLPYDYKTFIKTHNGATLAGEQIYGLKEPNNQYSLEECYVFEHYEVENEMPVYLVPFSPDGGGNHYCFDTRLQEANSCHIVFWQHDYSYSQDDPPEVTHNSFADWVKEVVIDWTLEDYNFDGTEK